MNQLNMPFELKKHTYAAYENIEAK